MWLVSASYLFFLILWCLCLKLWWVRTVLWLVLVFASASYQFCKSSSFLSMSWVASACYLIFLILWRLCLTLPWVRIVVLHALAFASASYQFGITSYFNPQYDLLGSACYLIFPTLVVWVSQYCSWTGPVTKLLKVYFMVHFLSYVETSLALIMHTYRCVPAMWLASAYSFCNISVSHYSEYVLYGLPQLVSKNGTYCSWTGPDTKRLVVYFLSTSAHTYQVIF